MNINIPRLSFSRFTLVLCLLLSTSITLADDTSALSTFNELNAIDIETAHLAIKNGSSEGVKSLAKMIVEDHEPIQRDAQRIGDKLGLQVTLASNNEEYAKTLEHLQSLSGPAFDKAYMAHELPFSQNFIRKLKEEILPMTTDDELKTFFQSLIPKFEEHIMHIKHIAMQLEAGPHVTDHNNGSHEKK